MKYPTACANSEPEGYVRPQVPPPALTDRASTVPSSARIRPRSIVSDRKYASLLSGLFWIAEASNTVQREVHATSSANSRITTTNSFWIEPFIDA